MNGFIEKRGSVYRYKIQFTPEEVLAIGKKSISKSGFPSEAKAKKALRKAMSDLDEGVFVVEQKLLVKDYLDQWHVHYKNNLAPSSAKRYKELLNTVKISLGNKELQKLTALDIQLFYDRLIDNSEDEEDKTLHPNTVIKIHRVLKMALNQAIVWGMLKSNPMAFIKPPKRKYSEMHCWTEEELITFLRAYKEGQFYLHAAIASGTGMRLGEICGLKWDCVDLKKGIITVRRTLSRLNGRWILKEPKTGKGRQIAIGNDLKDILLLHKKRQEKLINENTKYQDQSYVLTWEDDGRPYDRDYVSKHFHIQLKKLNCVPVIRFHDLRHTHATILLLNDIPVKVVSERLGHASISITLDIYTHVLPNMQKEAAEKINGILSKAK